MRKPKIFIALLRVALGWFFLYQGIASIIDQNWTILPYIKNPLTFASFYTLVGTAPYLQYTTYIVKGLFVIVGILLILGALSRLTALLGIILTLFFYFPLLHFPYVNSMYGTSSYYIVDEHILRIIILLYFFTVRSGEFFGMGSMFKSSRY